jgi:hypothetical protein
MVAKTHPARLRPPPSLFGFAGKRGLEIHYWFFYKILIFNVQPSLSTAGEERVAQRSVGRVES